METKLTLSLEKEVIEKAKVYAKSQNTSLSHLVENYFYYLTVKGLEDSKTMYKKSPLTDKLLGSVNIIENEINHDTLKEKYLMEKYLHD